MSRNFVAIANSYIEDVLTGRIVTCKWTRLACQRQKDDLTREWEYYFDPEAATVVCEFLELLTHVAGPLGGKRFVLEPWEAFFVTTLFGWREKATNLRRFRRSIVFAAKGNGKSFLSSGLSLFMLCADGEPGSQVYAAARSADQAKIVFDVSFQQVTANEELREAFCLRPMKKGIEHGPTGSIMRSVSAQGKSLAGLLPYFVSVDETWAHRDRGVVDEMRRGCAKRPGSLMSTISHAGADLGCVGYEQHEEACAILSGELVDERTFACIWSGEGYRWNTEDAWRAANPNYGISVDPVSLADAARLAEKITSQQSIFRSHNCVEWLNSDVVWIDIPKLVACREHGLKMETFKFWHLGEPNVTAPDVRRPFTLGLDLASRQDICAVVYLCIAYRDGVEHYFAFGDYWVPEHTIASSPVAKYESWAKRELIKSMPGFSNDLDAIQQHILSKYRRVLGYGAVENPDAFDFVLCGYDDWQGQQMSGNLEKAGIVVAPFPKTAKNYSPTMDFFTSLVLEGRFHFPADDEVLLWAIANVVAHRDKNDNLFPNKPVGDDRKIDPAIALLYALRAAMVKGGEIMRPVSGDAPRISFIFPEGSRTTDANGKLGELVPLEKEAKDGTC